MQVGGYQHMQSVRLQDHPRCDGIHEFPVRGDIGVVPRHLGEYFIPHDHAVALDVRFGDQGEVTARPVARQVEGKPHDPGHAAAGE